MSKFRSIEQIDAARRKYWEASKDAEIRGLPPGYISGFELSIEGNMPKVAAGVAKKEDSSRVMESQWTATKVSGFHYYVYLKREGDFTVDFLPPTYNYSYQAKYHPHRAWRYIGFLYIDSLGNTLFSLSYAYTVDREIIITTENLPVVAHYYCDNVDDQVEINRAIKYLSDYLGQGVVKLKGNFKISDSIEMKSGVTLDLREASIYRTAGVNIIDFNGGSGTEIVNAHVIGGTFTRADEDSVALIDLDHSDRCSIRGGTMDSIYDVGIDATLCDDLIIETMKMKNTSAPIDPATAINITECNNMIIKDNVIDGFSKGIVNSQIDTSTKAKIINNILTNVWRYGISLGDMRNGIVNGNTIEGMLSSQARGIDDASDSSQNIIINNTIKDVRGRMAIDINGNDYLIMNNILQNNGNLIVDSNCDETTTPVTLTEASATVVNGTWTRQTGDGYYSFCWELNATAGAGCYVVLQDNMDTNDLHDLVPGFEYKFMAWVKIYSATDLSRVHIRIGDYDSSWADTSAVATQHDWHLLSATRTIRAAATATRIWIEIDSPGTAADYVRVDEVIVQPQGYHNEHETQIQDSGTRTRSGMNSWQTADDWGSY
jgi:parallel beta-helix repeat protein